jgi:hypothetical protein
LERVGEGHYAACWNWQAVEQEIESSSLLGKKTVEIQNGF